MLKNEEFITTNDSNSLVGKYTLKGTKKDKVGYKVKRNHIPIVITRHGANTWTSDRLIPGRMK